MSYEKKPIKKRTTEIKESIQTQVKTNPDILNQFWNFSINPILGYKQNEADVNTSKYYEEESGVKYTGTQGTTNINN